MGFGIPWDIVERDRNFLNDDTTSSHHWSDSRGAVITVASYRRRQLVAEEVPGLYIRRLTLEDPKGAKDRSQSSSSRHVCYPRRRLSPPLIAPGRKTSSYRSVTQWLNRMKEEAPAFLTVTSLELPDSPIPLIDSQARIARCRSRDSFGSHRDDKDEIMEELLRKVVSARARKEGQKSKRNKVATVSPKCAREFSNLEEHTRRIIEGPKFPRERGTKSIQSEPERSERECICSEVSRENLRINIGEKTEVHRSSRSPSPEMTHVISIAMKYHGQEDNCNDENGEEETKEAVVATEDPSKHTDGVCCPGVSVSLDPALNCSSLQLTSRDVSVKPNKAKAASTRHLEQPIEDEA